MSIVTSSVKQVTWVCVSRLSWKLVDSSEIFLRGCSSPSMLVGSLDFEGSLLSSSSSFAYSSSLMKILGQSGWNLLCSKKKTSVASETKLRQPKIPKRIK